MGASGSHAAFGPEWAVLELVAGTPARDAGAAELHALLQAPGFDHGELLEQAARHKLGPLLAAHLVAAAQEPPMPGLVLRSLLDQLALGEHRVRALAAEARAAVAALESAGIAVACTKGIVTAWTVYERPAARMMLDVDLMVAPADSERAAATMRELGYVQGVWDLMRRRIAELPRRQALTYALIPDHLPHFLRARDEPVLPFVAIDVALSLTWERAPWSVPVEEALARRRRFAPGDEGVPPLPCLSPAYHFLFTVLHLFREAWLVSGAHQADVALVHFADLVRLGRAQRQAILADGFAELVARHRLEDPVAWVLAHADRTLGGDLLATFAPNGRSDAAWLQSARGRGGAPLCWSGTMRERLQGKQPPHMVAAAGDAVAPAS